MCLSPSPVVSSPLPIVPGELLYSVVENQSSPIPSQVWFLGLKYTQLWLRLGNASGPQKVGFESSA